MRTANIKKRRNLKQQNINESITIFGRDFITSKPLNSLLYRYYPDRERSEAQKVTVHAVSLHTAVSKTHKYTHTPGFV